LRDRFYIAIEGVIGVGKTTLARLAQERLRAELLLEVFEANPFLSSFYEDRARYAFQTQIFFLLSRYRQQHEVIPQTVQRRALVSDYTFAKDRLFAHLNLAGDELHMYERVHAILARNIPLPDLVVYLRADTDTLMQRIASRDRSYERNMSRQYIDDLRQAYETFFAGYAECPVLRVDTRPLNIVSRSEDLENVISQIRAALEQRAYQPSLLDAPADGPAAAAAAGRALAQARAGLGDQTEGRRELFLDYMRLMGEMGQLGAQMAQVWGEQARYERQVGNQIEARQLAVQAQAGPLRAGFTRSLKRLLELAEAAGVDLDQLNSA
jgi:deoxyadenosine/deoxycytidine kinase